MRSLFQLSRSRADSPQTEDFQINWFYFADDFVGQRCKEASPGLSFLIKAASREERKLPPRWLLHAHIWCRRSPWPFSCGLHLLQAFSTWPSFLQRGYFKGVSLCTPGLDSKSKAVESARLVKDPDRKWRGQTSVMIYR